MPPRTVSSETHRFQGIRVVYTDLDGTMLGAKASFLHDPDGSPTLEGAKALLAAQSAGVDVVPSSGRALRGLITDGRMLAMPNVIAEMGAHLAYDHGRDQVENFGATPDPGPPARVMEQRGIVDLILREFHDRLEHHQPWSSWRECTHLFRGRVDVDAVTEVLVANGHDWLALHDNGRLHGDYLGLGLGGSSAYHLIPHGVSKGSAVELDRTRRGFAREESVAIGDARADLTFAQAVGTVVFVRDAVEGDEELARAVASLDNAVVTDRPMNLGWADMLTLIAEQA